MTNRLLTKRQEQIFKLCHHDFEGLTQEEAAKRLGIVQSVIAESLAHVEKILPKFFPIITGLEMKCYHYYITEGWSVKDIAEHLNRSENAIYKTLQRARNKEMFFPPAKGRVLSYDPSMDAHIKHKF